MSMRRGPALDGWRVAELRLLPGNILELCATLLNGVEEGWLEWPRVLTMGITSCLPKWDVDADHAADVNPDHLWVAEAEQTRPITNLSHIYTAGT
eukprot:7756960-Pyramimonas_sp.AAC.1